MRPAYACFAALALAACGGRDPVADNLQNNDELPIARDVSPSPTASAPANAAEPTAPANMATAAETAAPAEIPAALRGRWGLTPRDCTSALGDAKGLLVVNANELRFYESRAVPSANIQTSPDSISGDFAFTGEGQKWTRHETLEVQDGNLVRTDRDPMASFRYVRC
ncbi:MAG TPA: hypothetical protein VFP53_01905 [Sphingomicrobium sp.]|nr:hypothetical protein [Sphingomicrobium sp.]